MKTLFFVTPAWGRFALTAACLAQRANVIEELAEKGIEGRCVVVADDVNLDIARSLGFDVVERDNEWLGRRFNDGMEYAGRHGADWIVPIGSDSWILPSYFDGIDEVSVRTSANYAVVETQRMAVLRVGGRGAGPYVFPRAALEPSGFRPAADEIRRGVDHSTLRGIGEAVWERLDAHPLQYIGFRGKPHITPYNALSRRWGISEDRSPWEALADLYPPALVERARMALEEDHRA